jgi:hypothetical protein
MDGSQRLTDRRLKTLSVLFHRHCFRLRSAIFVEQPKHIKPPALCVAEHTRRPDVAFAKPRFYGGVENPRALANRHVCAMRSIFADSFASRIDLPKHECFKAQPHRNTSPLARTAFRLAIAATFIHSRIFA